MANRRMFSRSVVESDYFLDMSQGAQLLYFHVGMHADDDGFCSNVKTIARMLGVGQDCVEELEKNSFIITFEDKACAIKHWRVNNSLRSDRKQRTEFRKDLEKLYLKDNGIYTLDPSKGTSITETPKPVESKNCLQVANDLHTDGIPSIGKYRLVKDSIGENRLVQVSRDTKEDSKGEKEEIDPNLESILSVIKKQAGLLDCDMPPIKEAVAELLKCNSPITVSDSIWKSLLTKPRNAEEMIKVAKDYIAKALDDDDKPF